MKKTYLFLAFICLVLSVQSQSYSFTHIPPGTMPYSDLEDDIELSTFDANGLFILEEVNGETFWLYELPFIFGWPKTIAIGENAFLRVDNDSSLIIIDAAFTYMEEAYADSRVSYKIEGNPGSRIVKAQYKNMKFTSGIEDNFLNVQIWYYQSTGVIEIHYGARSDSNSSGFSIVNGPNVGIFYSPDDFSGCYEKTWCNGNPDSPTLNTASNYVFHAMQGLPMDGTVYRFSPLFLISGVKEKTEIAGPVFPNPAESELILKDVALNSEIEVFNSEGKQVHKFRCTSLPLSLDVAALGTGVYTLHYLSVKEQKVIERFVKK